MERSTMNAPKPAYIFGGLEALVFQGLIAGFFGAAWTLKSYWRRIKAYFTGSTAKEVPESDVEQDPSDS